MSSNANLLQLQNGSKSYGAKNLLKQASFSINQGEHVGFIGANGTGKTTLFKILTGQEELDSGNIIKTQGLRIGYLEQESEWDTEQMIEDFLEAKCQLPMWQLKQIGEDLGLSDAHFSAKMKTLSGGYRMRVNLLRLIGQEPDLMLLDEPTNFLDLETVIVLEKFLQNYEKAYLLISHDREFLRRTTEHILELENGELIKFPGNIDDYFEQKAELEELLKNKSANLEAKKKDIQSFIDRFKAKASKAKQAQSRMKLLDKMGSIKLKDKLARARIPIPLPTKTGKDSLRLENVNLGYGTNTILSGVNFRLERGQHLGVVGFNGAGKSTLLKALAKRLEPLTGSIVYGHEVRTSYFAQHVVEDLFVNESVLENLQRAAHSEVTAQEIKKIAGALLFPGDDVHKKIHVLSGGEKSRVALGQILLKKNPVLLLDEPTNHLDFETVEALTEALANYEGTIVTVSHDRGFIASVATKILEIHHGKAEFFPGSYEEYLWSLEKGALSARLDHVVHAAHHEMTPAPEKKKVNFKEEKKRLDTEIALNKKRLKTLEIEVAHSSHLRDQLTQDLLTAQGPGAAAIAKELSSVSNKIEAYENEMMEKMELVDQLEKSLKSL